jgi:pimeloyl-ACP methyl ester carboxylesterase
MEKCYRTEVLASLPSTLNTLRTACVFILTLLFVYSGQIFPATAAGFQTLTSNDMKIGIWYPSDTPAKDGRIGPFDVRLAFDAPPKSDGKYQFILMSHGILGRWRNHQYTATALADAGFIVIAPEHSPDHLLVGDDIPEVLDYRARELQYALEAVLQIDSFRRIADLSRIHAIGYSLGTVTVLNAAGVGIDTTVYDEHCAQNDDPNVCEPTTFIERWGSRFRRDIVSPDLDRDITPRYFPLGFVNGGVAVIAPVGTIFAFDDNTFRARGLFIVGLEEDVVAQPEFHANNLPNIIPERYIRHFSIRPGSHFAFISPFAKRVTDIEDIPAAEDPPGFDRKAFLDTLNQDLAAFFVAQS